MWVALLCLCDQSLDEVLPGGKDKVGADEEGILKLKEIFARPKRLACLLPECLQPVARGVECKGEHVHGSEHSGQAFVAAPKVVGQVIAIAFQHVEGFVLALPENLGAGGDLHEVLGRDWQVGQESPA